MSQSNINRVLVMEHDRATEKQILKKLTREKWIVDIVHTPHDGLEAHRKESYDVLCIDHAPPDIDGLSVIREIVNHVAPPPILFITATGTEEAAVEAIRSGVDDYLIKDIDGKYLDLLIPLIEKIILQHQNERQRRITQNERLDVNGRFKMRMNSLTDGIWHVNADARTTYITPRIAKMLGYTTGEMIGMHLSELVDKEVKKSAPANREHRDETHEKQNDLEFVGKKGERMYASLETAEVFDDTGRHVGSITGIRNITEQKIMENDVSEGESQVGTTLKNIRTPEEGINEFNLADVTDIPALQSMLDLFYELTNIGLGIFDVKGTLLASNWWSDLCTKFHRANPESAKHCLESDIELTTGVKPGEFKLYQCKNHMWDMVTPIMVGDLHAGNLFIGQFFFDDEEVDYELFRSQARKYGFDEEEYITALEKIPRRNRETLNIGMSFFSQFAMTISKLSYSNVKLAKTLTERDILLELLGDSEKRYRRMIDSSPAMIFLVRDGKYVYANPAAAWELGYESPEDFIDLPVEHIIEPTTQPELLERMRLSAEDGIANPPLEIRVVRADGSILISESTSIPIHLDEGDAVLVMGRNVTDKKIAEDALRESEAKFRELFDSSMDVVFVSEAEGGLVDINKAGEELLGYSRDELLKMDIRDIYLNPSDRDAIRKSILEKGFAKNYEVMLKKKDESSVESIVTATVRRNADGEIIGYQGIVKDITELKRTQNQLIQAQKMEAIGTLAGGIAHDFNNVLATIMGYSSFLKKKVTRNVELRDGLELIERASTRASDLTSQLLTYTRKSTREIRAINLNRILREVHTLVSKTFDKSIRIRLDTEENLPTIEGDESQIYQVIMNIAVNAQHAMPDGGDLTIETYEVNVPEVIEKTYFTINPGNYVCVKIVDTGVGMDEETLSKIYEPYFTTRGDRGGSGLGMSVVFGIVRSHNGYIDVSSTTGHGSEVVISFPVSEREEKQKRSEHSDVYSGTEDILVIDDEMMILQMARDILEESGYTVRTTLSGKEGIEAAKRTMPDLVILDLKMPEMDGRLVLQQLIDMDPNVRILIASGYVEDNQRNELLTMGAFGFIHKPFTADVLSMNVRRILDTPRS